jgi:cullin 3
MDRGTAGDTWDVLANAIDEIYNRNASQLSFEELYRNAYNLVLHKHGSLLYEGVSDKLSSHLQETVKRLSEVPDSSLLEEMATTWSEHQVNFRIRKSLSTFFTCSRRANFVILGCRLP